MSALAPYDVSAFNTAVTSENKIHDDDVARRFGFTGALVPGVEVYAYMAHMPVARWAATGSNAAAPNAASSSRSTTETSRA